jgi:hypothetical protein
MSKDLQLARLHGSTELIKLSRRQPRCLGFGLARRILQTRDGRLRRQRWSASRTAAVPARNQVVDPRSKGSWCCRAGLLVLGMPAIAAYRAALQEWTRDRVPLHWAATQDNLGIALRVLGERESRTALLEDAAAAHRAALEELTRERVPLEWATTQTNLGNTLRALGERESGTARLEEAAAAYRAALEERTRERVPLDWAQS